MSLKYFLLFFLIGSSTQASLVTNLSYTENVYVCNAGVRHQNVSSEPVMGQDVIYVTHIDTRLPENNGARLRTTRLITSAGDGKWVSLFDNETDSWYSVLQDLKFSFSTEIYGAEYFVDVCYLGPVTKIQNKKDLSEGFYSLALNLGVSELASDSSTSYSSSSGLIAQVTTVCDLRRKGQLTADRKANEVSLSSYIEPDSYSQSDYFSMDANSLLYETDINKASTEVPRYCKMRLFFKESKNTAVRLNNISIKDILFNLDFTKK